MRSQFLSYLAFVFLTLPCAAFAQPEPGAASAPENAARDVKREALLKQAFAQEDAGNLKAAIATYGQILDADPSDVRAMNSIAGLNGTLGDFEAEAFWAAKAIASNPGFHPAHINRGNALMQLGRTDEAKASFEQAIALEPRDPIGYYSLGVVAEQQRDLTTALEFYRKATEVDPKFESAHFNQAAAHANLGQFGEAIAALNTLLELNPKAQDARDMLAAIERDRK